MKSIWKFNTYCKKVADLYNPESNIPLPLPLPIKLAELHNNSCLMEDIWITLSESDKIPSWLEGSDIRGGIHAMVKSDWCVEKHQHLGMESDNICQWFGRELNAVELALKNLLCKWSIHTYLFQQADWAIKQIHHWTFLSLNIVIISFIRSWGG